MLPFEDRYTRQRQLAEVGLDGQARLEAAPYDLTSTTLHPLAQVVAADYLRRSGVPLDSSVPSLEPLPYTSGPEALIPEFRFQGPSHVAAGALAALNHIRGVLGLDTKHSPK